MLFYNTILTNQVPYNFILFYIPHLGSPKAYRELKVDC
jgi:hypothetical protein